ncbi:MAG: glycosyltransferase [Clostridia bacterium]
MNKVIHYCWFGNKPLPKLAKKCIKSWQKYLPDFTIKEWNETNFDINECSFTKEAYENKKWAFIADYARVKALYEEGGLYLDTDMEIISNIDQLLKDEMFIGREENGYIAAGTIWVKNKKNKYMKEMLEFYKSLDGFDISKLWSYSIPTIVTKILRKYETHFDDVSIELIDNTIRVYPSEYFYPINYDFSKKIYTENTCMVHYYNATWVSKSEKITITIYRTFGVKVGKIIVKIFTFPIRIFRKIKNLFKTKTKNIMYRLKQCFSIYFNINKRLKSIQEKLDAKKDCNYLVIHNPDWLGVTSSTCSLFENTVGICDVFTEKEGEKIAKLLCSQKKELLIFSGIARGYSCIIENIRKIDKKVIIKVLWHGSNALLVEDPDWYAFERVLSLYKRGDINELGFVKKSMYEFFKAKGYHAAFIPNTVDIDIDEIKKENVSKPEGLCFGLYASLDRWVKNTYNQISAISLFEGAKIDITPMNYKTEQFAQILGLDTSLSNKTNIKRSKLLANMARNDVNVYVTFTECSPMIPLESLELGVPCITGDNHHYFENTKLEEYLIVTKEDNIMAIYDKIEVCLENKDKIIQLYKEWKKKYCVNAQKAKEDFLRI